MDNHNTENQNRVNGRPTCAVDEKLRMGDVIRRYRLGAKLEQKELANMLDCTANAVGAWENGRSRPSLELVPELCRILKMPIHELLGTDVYAVSHLTGEDEHVLSCYHALSSANRHFIVQMMEEMGAEQRMAEQRIIRKFVGVLPRVDELSPAAGPGVPALERIEAEAIYLRRSRAFEASNLVTKVCGDSMEPDFPDGSLIFVNTNEETPLDEVGIFVVDGEFFIKERHADCLFSHNRAHTDIMFNEGMDIRHFGRVIGLVDEDDILVGADLESACFAWENPES